MSNRYSNDFRINLGQQIGSASAVRIIRAAIKNGTLPISRTITLTGSDRLDTLAGLIYGDAKYWWLLAAASNIGWGLQIPAGTLINIVNLESASTILGQS